MLLDDPGSSPVLVNICSSEEPLTQTFRFPFQTPWSGVEQDSVKSIIILITSLQKCLGKSIKKIVHFT